MRWIITLLLLGLANASVAQTPAEDVKSGLVVPRFVSIKKDKAYLRTGPGDQYPVKWQYVRAGLPLEVIREWDAIWFQVRDSEGEIGWMNRSMLTGERTAVVTRSIRTLYEGADLQSRPVWRIAPNAVVRVVLCESAWCRITRDGKGGYILRNQLWGVYPTESIAN
jgi:SH3-like domain-containing protein